MRVQVTRCGVVGDQVVPDGRIDITGNFDEVSYEKAEARFDKEAIDIADVLFATLPGGTLDRLIVEMLSRTVSRRTVRYRVAE